MVWGQGNTIWIFNHQRYRFHAFDRLSGQRTRGQDISTKIPLRTPNSRQYYLTVWGVWSDGETMWISGRASPGGQEVRNGIYQIDLATGEITRAVGFKGVRGGRGLWSDGTFMWVVSNGDKKLQA